MSGICPDCGRSWEDARHGGRLGCPSCWDAFRQELSETIAAIHGSSNQPTEIELVAQLRKRRRVQLEESLKAALATEDYALAGELRDRLRQEEDAA